jgi:hypothetical protein
MFRPNKYIHKLIISSTSRFVGEYENDDMLITHAWPSLSNSAQVPVGLTENPYSRNYYAVVFKTEPSEKDKRGETEFLCYDWFAEFVCIYLSILFGKRFDCHGLIETNGFFFLPDIVGFNFPIRYPNIGINNHQPRKDLEIELNFSNFKKLEPLLVEKLDRRSISIMNTAGKFYVRSIRLFEVQPELAFLDLVACGEVLSNYYQYTDEELYDQQLREQFTEIENELSNGSDICKNIKSRLYQIRRKYVLTIMKLLNPYFFQNTECLQGFASLKQNDIEKRVKASYDLRSLYVHEGIRIENWLDPEYFMNEVQVGIPVVESKTLKKLLCLTPTYIGMERIIRFCLLRFLHTNGVPIDSRLD